MRSGRDVHCLAGDVSGRCELSERDRLRRRRQALQARQCDGTNNAYEHPPGNGGRETPKASWRKRRRLDLSGAPPRVALPCRRRGPGDRLSGRPAPFCFLHAGGVPGRGGRARGNPSTPRRRRRPPDVPAAAGRRCQRRNGCLVGRANAGETLGPPTRGRGNGPARSTSPSRSQAVDRARGGPTLRAPPTGRPAGAPRSPRPRGRADARRAAGLQDTGFGPTITTYV